VAGILWSSERSVGSASYGEPPSSRRRRLRSIADEDRRARYGLAPGWLEVGALVQSASDGLVMIRAVARGSAEVVPLNGAEPHWVKLRDLSPPR
jgi:hypothetical protein